MHHLNYAYTAHNHQFLQMFYIPTKWWFGYPKNEFRKKVFLHFFSPPIFDMFEFDDFLKVKLNLRVPENLSSGGYGH